MEVISNLNTFSFSVPLSGCFSLGGLNPELYKTKSELEEDDGTEYPEHHVGRVWFGLEYDTGSERLIVALIKARNLPESRSGGSSCNPFVRVALFPDERRTLQSKPKKNTKDPYFNETFGFQVKGHLWFYHIFLLLLCTFLHFLEFPLQKTTASFLIPSASDDENAHSCSNLQPITTMIHEDILQYFSIDL